MAEYFSHSHRSGFTLIELSIVLVIIGLIVGGILVGRDMIRQSEVRSVMTDVDRYKTALNTFKLKYDCLPGDCPNATTYFPARADGCPNGTGAGVCNGNGDGTYGYPGGDFEYLWVWQHLSQAQLVGGNYTGVGTLMNSSVGVNSPASRISGVGYTIAYMVYTGTLNGGYIVPGSAAWGDHIGVGKAVPSGMTGGAFLSSKEAYALDSKYDDGNPIKGVLTVNPAGTCAYVGASADDPGTQYNRNPAMSDDIRCNLVFDLQF